MKKTKIWLFTAVLLILIGCIIFGCVMTMLKWDFFKLSTTKYETNEYTVNENYNNISIATDTSDIVFIPSDNTESKIVFYEYKNEKHLVNVEEGTLNIKITNTKKWYEYIGINFGKPKISVYIPQRDYGALSVHLSTGDVKIPEDFKFYSIDISGSTGDISSNATATETVKIKTSTGDIYTENISAKSADFSVSTGEITVKNATFNGDTKIKVSTGKVNLINVKCQKLITSGSTGDISMTDVIAEEKFFIERSTGDVSFKKCDAKEIFIETDTGSVNGTLLTEKVFVTETDTGKIHVPKTTTGGRCEIKTSTGNIKIDIAPN